MKTKKSERQKAVKECDKWFSLYIRQRDGVCYCGCIKQDPLQCCHLFSRSNYSTRWNENYSHAGHSGCNMEHEYHPEKMTLWFIKKFGQENYEKGVLLHNSVLKISTNELFLMANSWKEKYEKIKELEEK